MTIFVEGLLVAFRIVKGRLGTDILVASSVDLCPISTAPANEYLMPLRPNCRHASS